MFLITDVGIKLFFLECQEHIRKGFFLSVYVYVCLWWEKYDIHVGWAF